MRILVIADVHGQYKKLRKLVSKIKEPFDMVVTPGDITDMYSLPSEFTQLDIANLVVQCLLSMGKPLLAVPGNHDPYEILDIFEEYGVNLHAAARKMNGIMFMGYGGAATPFNTHFEPGEEEIKKHLFGLSSNVKEDFILIVHNPPKGTKVDATADGKHVGSEVIRNFILEKKPLLAISAHIHEAAGTDRLGETTLFYPGVCHEGNYGIVEITGKEVKCEIKKIDIK
ncbi:MAG: metallophosphoesterase [Candidatus Aenigmarchaeota archaeon]|nr:metallophosphoesterase [Candidatus Aenigmarchaeota archaeon]